MHSGTNRTEKRSAFKTNLVAQFDRNHWHTLTEIGGTNQTGIATSQKEWDLERLAQIAGMSRTSFVNRFKDLIGDTPFSYITQWRILQAQAFLTESDLSVREIAEKVGYQSEAAFNRVFKKRMNQTPLKYRQDVLTS